MVSSPHSGPDKDLSLQRPLPNNRRISTEDLDVISSLHQWSSKCIIVHRFSTAYREVALQ